MEPKAKLPDSFIRARRHLLLDHPFFGSLVMYLEPKVDVSQETLWVDGKTLGFNPQFLERNTLEENAGVLAHGILHCGFEHHLRREQRDPKLWNEACDYAINPIVQQSGLPLPSGALLDQQYTGKGAEEIYALLTQKQQAEKDRESPDPQPTQNLSRSPSAPSPLGVGSGEPQKTPSTPLKTGSRGGLEGGEETAGAQATGTVRDLPGNAEDDLSSPAEQSTSANEWKVHIQQAANNARGQGFLPAELDRVVKELLQPKVDWRQELRKFFQSVRRSESTWMRPNRRFIGSGLYLPGLRVEAAGTLVIGIDTSGSINQQLLNQFAGELTSIIEDTQPERVYVVYCDAVVQGVAEFTADDLPLELHPKGGGGTSFIPVFDWIEKTGIQPECLVYFTDMQGEFPAQDPGYPVLWGSTSNIQQAPFGEVINIKEVFHESHSH